MTRFRRPAHTELFWAVGRAERLRLCAELISLAGHGVVFCRNVPEAIRVAGDLSLIGVPAASVEHRDFTSSRVRAQVVTDETAVSCGPHSAGCVIQFDPALTARRYRRRVDLVATEGAIVVSFVVPEREGDVRRLLRSLDRPDVLTGPDVAAVADSLADVLAHPVRRDGCVDPGAGTAPAAPAGNGSRPDRALSLVRAVIRGVPHGASRARHALSRGIHQVRRHRAGSEDDAA